MNALFLTLVMLSLGLVGEIEPVKPNFDEPINAELYLIRPGDKLAVTFVGAKIASLSLSIDGEGKIVHETIGMVDLSGTTLATARAQLGEILGRLYNAREIVISISETRKVSIGISGAVAEPGFYKAYTSDRVSDIIEMAGGISSGGSTRKIIFRGGPTDLEVDLDRALLLGDQRLNSPLYAGRNITVPQRTSKVVQVVGAVSRPGEIELVDGDTIESLLALAGGLTESADRANIQIMGADNKAHQEIEPGDLIIVPFKNAGEAGYISIFGEVTKPGRYSFDGPMLLDDLLTKSGGFKSSANAAQITLFRKSARDLWTGKAHVVYPIAGLMKDSSPIQFSLQVGDSVFVPSLLGWVRVSGEVSNPGFFPYESGHDAAYYVALAGGFLDGADKNRIGKFSRIAKTTTEHALGVSVFDGDEIIVRNLKDEDGR